MKSLGAMIVQLHAMVGTDDLSEWESGFVQSVYDHTREGKNTAYLSGKQITAINDIYTKHFGD